MSQTSQSKTDLTRYAILAGLFGQRPRVERGQRAPVNTRPSRPSGGAYWRYASLIFVMLCLVAVVLVLGASPAAANPGQWPATDDIDMELTVPPDIVSRGNPAGDVVPGTLSTNGDEAATEIALDKELIGADMDDEFPNYVTFTIEVSNSGVTTLDIIPLIDRYDPYFLSFVDATPYPAVLDNDGGLVTWSDLTLSAPHGFGANLDPDEAFEVTVVFTLVHDIITSTTNIARVENAEDVNGAAVDPVEDEEVVAGLPTAVDLLSFTAAWSDGVIVARWETAWERDNWGFDLYRGLTPDFADAQWIHFEPGKGRGEFDGESYRYEDANVLEDQGYYYWLVDIDLNNQVAGTWMRGPVSASTTPVRIYLPAISR